MVDARLQSWTWHADTDVPRQSIRPRIVPHHDDSNGWWKILSPVPPAIRLTGEKHVETAIIGAGICGIAVAHQLGKLAPQSEIAVLEAERAGFGASGRNAGFMLNLHSHGPPKKIDILRRNMQLWESGLDDLRRMVRDFQIACDWHEFGRIYGSAGPDGEKHIDEIADTLDQLGLSFSWLGAEQMQSRLGTDFYRRGLHAGGSALVNPAALLRGLARNLPVNVSLYEESPVAQLDRVSNGFEIVTETGVLRADRVVVAAGVFMRQFGVAAGRFVPMATYASLTPPLSESELSHLGTAEPYGLLGGSEYGATIRLTRDNRLFVRNVFKHVPGSPTSRNEVSRISALHRSAMLNRWPGLADVTFEHSWGGIMAFTWNDGTIFGEIEPGLFAVLTNDVSPMTRGAAAGRLLADYMSGRSSALLSTQLSIPTAMRLPPRPFLDIGVAVRRGMLHFAAKKEF